MRRDVLSNDAQKIVATYLPHEFELLPQVFDRYLVSARRPKIICQSGVFFVKINDLSSVVNDSRQVAAIPNHPCILGKFFYVIG